MRILHVVSSLNVGGAERFVIDLAVEQKNNLQYSVGILSMGKPDEPLEAEVQKYQLELFHGTNLTSIRQLLKQFDIVHVHSSYCLLRVLLASLFIDIKIVYTRHNERVHQSFKWRVIYLLAYYKLHKMVFVAEKARRNYLQKYPQFKQKSLTILNGVLPMSSVKKESSLFRLSHVGRFVPLKAQHYLIEAIAKLSLETQGKISVSFFGTGECLQYNQELAQNIVPEVEINFRGFVTDRNDIYQNTDVLIVTSETEGLSLAILEALASGTPIIASNVGGNSELIKHQKNGLLYEFSDSDALAQYIQLLIDKTETYQSFSEKCVSVFNSGFSMQICARKYANVYI